jgi:hypothetical protein
MTHEELALLDTVALKLIDGQACRPNCAIEARLALQMRSDQYEPKGAAASRQRSADLVRFPHR